MSNRKRRAEIAQKTLQILETGIYQSASKQEIDIQETLKSAVEETKLYTPDSFKKEVFPKRDEVLKKQTFDTVFEITTETTLQAASRLFAEEEQDILALNFASAKNPGGGFLGGSQAQEESLARSSGLYACLQTQMDLYLANRKRRTGLYSDHMIYSPNVPVFRNDDNSLLDMPYPVSMITSPAVNVGSVKANYPQEEELIESTMLDRTEKMLSLAISYQYEVLVLGAWGCGVFKNAPQDVARYFATFLRNDGRFAQAFRKVVFAVYSSQKNNPNYAAFQSLFEA